MDLLELLRKRGMDGDDLLREARLRVLVDGIMDAEVSAQIGARSTANAARSGSPTATAGPGTPGWAPCLHIAGRFNIQLGTSSLIRWAPSGSMPMIT